MKPHIVIRKRKGQYRVLTYAPCWVQHPVCPYYKMSYHTETVWKYRWMARIYRWMKRDAMSES